MAVDESVREAEKYSDGLVDLLKPGADFKAVRPKLEEALPRFRDLYKAKATHGSKLETEYNNVAAAFLTALYGIGHDDPTNAGSEIKNWLQKVGNDALPKLKSAIEAGDQTEIESILKQAYQNNQNKVETLLAQVREKSDDTKMAFYGRLGSYVGDINGYKASPVTVAENTAAAVQALGQRLATAKTFSKG